MFSQSSQSYFSLADLADNADFEYDGKICPDSYIEINKNLFRSAKSARNKKLYPLKLCDLCEIP